MNTSAKVTAIALLAACSLGVAIFSACTVTSTTNPDTDGGITNPNPSATDSTPVPGTDAGDAGGGGAACGQDLEAGAPVRSSTCQTCLQTKCATQLNNCLALDAGVSCAEYGNCIDCCNGEKSCEDLCDQGTPDSVSSAYDALGTCSDGPENANLQPGQTPTAASDNCVKECDSN
jgi:hypothetical protein